MVILYFLFAKLDPPASSQISADTKMKNFLTNFPLNKVSVFVTIVVSFTYNVLLDRDVACTCEDDDHINCNLYMILPFFIIFFLIVWTEKKFFSTFNYLCGCKCSGPCPNNCSDCCSCCCSGCCSRWCPDSSSENPPNNSSSGASNPPDSSSGCCSRHCPRCCPCCKSCCDSCCDSKYCCQFWWIVIISIFKAGLVGLLWVVSVLIDGDWYVCCKNDGSEQQKHLACKKTNITALEQVEISQLKNYSRNIGFGVILGILFITTLMSVKCWRKCCDKDSLYRQLIAEEGESMLNDTLRLKAKYELRDEIRRKIRAGKLSECFDVAEKLIDSDPTGRCPGE
ncbi:uncharacterized protein ACNS7B_008719 [Menidia menidia]